MSDLADTLRQIIREEVTAQITVAYEHGFAAGRREALDEIDRHSYRRGYYSGYHAGRTGSPEASDPEPQRRRRHRVNA